MDFASTLGRDFADMVASGLLPEEPTAEDIEGQLYAIYRSKGVSLVIDERGVIVAVQFYGLPKDGMCRFEGELPEELSLNMGRTEVRSVLGKPSSSKEAPFRDEVLGAFPPWDKWARADHSLHAEYDFAAPSIRLFSLLRETG